MSKSKKFANALARRLRNASVEDSKPRCYVVRGKIDTAGALADIVVCVSWRFSDLKKFPPVVVCNEPWMKKEADWHNTDYLCWIIPPQWHEVMGWKGKPIQAIIDEGCDWLVNGVSNLIARHHLAHLEGIEHWPPEWDAWAHGKKGISEYYNSPRENVAVQKRR